MVICNMNRKRPLTGNDEQVRREKKQEKNKNETDLEMILEKKNDPPLHILFSHPLVYRPSEAAKM